MLWRIPGWTLYIPEESTNVGYFLQNRVLGTRYDLKHGNNKNNRFAEYVRAQGARICPSRNDSVAHHETLSFSPVVIR